MFGGLRPPKSPRLRHCLQSSASANGPPAEFSKQCLMGSRRHDESQDEAVSRPDEEALTSPQPGDRGGGVRDREASRLLARARRRREVEDADEATLVRDEASGPFVRERDRRGFGPRRNEVEPCLPVARGVVHAGMARAEQSALARRADRKVLGLLDLVEVEPRRVARELPFVRVPDVDAAARLARGDQGTLESRDREEVLRKAAVSALLSALEVEDEQGAVVAHEGGALLVVGDRRASRSEE